jgi:hypothetical protein
MEKLVMECRTGGTQLIIGCDANAHHTSWGSSDNNNNNNNRGNSLFNYIMANGLDIMNRGNTPTFVTTNRQAVIDIMIASNAGNFVKDWRVTDEVSCSDHRYIRFNIMGVDRIVEFCHNPRRTDWGSFRTDLSGSLASMTDITPDFMDLEAAAVQFQDAVVSAYNDNCPLTERKNNRNVRWWNRDLSEKSR